MKYMPFVCNHDAGRSQMAQAFFERYASIDVRAESAGSHTATPVWPEVIEVMRELDIDLSEPKEPDFARVIILTLAESTPIHEAGRLPADLRRAGIEPHAWLVDATLTAAPTGAPIAGARR